MDVASASRKKISLYGLVQGMGFRPFVYRLAIERGLSGSVRNTPFGIEIEVKGPSDKVASFVSALETDCPHGAIVTQVEIEDLPLEVTAGPRGDQRGDQERLGDPVDFKIDQSSPPAELTMPVLPDIAPCTDCLRELFDLSDRRYHYPFINCQNCGPRASIIDSLPYDRERTIMREFKMCSQCREEYEDPLNRRFHAEPCACPKCGPTLQFFRKDKNNQDDGDQVNLQKIFQGNQQNDQLNGQEDNFLIDHPGEHLSRGEVYLRGGTKDGPVESAARALSTGQIVAVKGIGGYQLACDARNDHAVNALRQRKKRSNKPFAVMVKDIAAAQALCTLDEQALQALAAPEAPIVLAPIKNRDLTEAARPTHPSMFIPYSPLSRNVAPGLSEVGIMLPSSPLHHLLLRSFDGPLVMTSGNLSDEPIAIDDDEARSSLSGIADAFLIHDRQILNRFDDSVVRSFPDHLQMVRRSRGLSPLPIIPTRRTKKGLARLNSSSRSRSGFGEGSGTPHEPSKCVFAAGADLKSTFTYFKNGMHFTSQHIGDLDNTSAADHYLEAAKKHLSFFHFDPQLVVHDLHPGYRSSQLAAEIFPGVPTLAVQHHHAHIASVIGEHDLQEDVLGIAMDGTGYGSDGTVWGGELLVLRQGERYLKAHRAGHLAHMPLIGGDLSARSPALMAYSAIKYLAVEGRSKLTTQEFTDHERETAIDDLWLSTRLDASQREIADISILQGPELRTSSAGRLFDAVAAILNIAYANTFEGEAAMRLEAACHAGQLELELPVFQNDGLIILDTGALLMQVLTLSRSSYPAGEIAYAFTSALARSLAVTAVAIGEKEDLQTVCLSGGVWQNQLLYLLTQNALEKAGFKVYSNILVPVNDGGISLGQAYLGSAFLSKQGDA